MKTQSLGLGGGGGGGAPVSSSSCRRRLEMSRFVDERVSGLWQLVAVALMVLC